MNKFDRTNLLIGDEGLNKLKNSKVAVFGIGGVGSFAVEALARSGIGNITLIDNDIIDITNINRQIHANIETVGKPKVEIMKERILKINPDINVNTYQIFYDSNCKEIIFNFDYIIDAIDSIPSKIELCVNANKNNILIISSMGAGNKLDPTKFEISDIYSTSVDPIAKIMRKELKAQNIKSLKVVYSKELPIRNVESSPATGKSNSLILRQSSPPGSIAFIPSVVGLILAGEVIRDLIKEKII